MTSLASDGAFALAAASMAALIFAWFGVPLTVGRVYFLAGILSAYVAYVVALIVGLFLAHAATELPTFVVATLDPAIEEPIRLIALFAFLSPTKDRGCWLAFAIGYALLESSLKLGDNLAALGQSNNFPRIAVLLSVPLAPLTLHIFLGVVAMRLRSMNAAALLVLLVTFLLHFAHNFSTFALPRPEKWTFVVIEVWGRSLLFVLLTVFIVRRGNRG